MYVVARNAVPFATAVFDRIFMGRICTRRTIVSMLVTMTGTIIYTAGDKDTRYEGCVVAFLNAALVSGMCVFESALMGRVKGTYTPVEMNFYRTFLSTPIVLVLAQREHPSRGELIASGYLLTTSGAMAFSFGTILYYLQGRVSATTIQMTNISYKFATVVASRVTHPADISPMGWFGYMVCTAGMVNYAIGQQQAQEMKSQ